MNQCNCASFGDREMMDDALSAQKHITGQYNSFANECSSPALMSEFMNILNEEHQIQHEIFDDMQKRGWYAPEKADTMKVEQCRSKFQNQNN